MVLLSMLEEWHAVYFLLLLKRWNEHQMNCIVSEVNIMFHHYILLFYIYCTELIQEGLCADIIIAGKVKAHRILTIPLN